VICVEETFQKMAAGALTERFPHVPIWPESFVSSPPADRNPSMFRRWLERLRPKANRRLRRGVSTPPRRISTRLNVTALEDRVTPSAVVQIDAATGFNFHTAVAADSQGNAAFLYNGIDLNSGLMNTFVRWTDPTGQPVGNPVQVNAASDGDSVGSALAVAPDGRSVVVWVDDIPGADGYAHIWAKEFNADHTAAGSQFVVAPYPGFYWDLPPTVSLDDNGDMAFAWTGPATGSSVERSYVKFVSWDLQSQTDAIALGSGLTAGSQSPRLAVSAAGTLIASFTSGAAELGAVAPGFVQPIDYVADGSGGFTVTAGSSPIEVDPNAVSVRPIALSDGGFAAVVDVEPPTSFGQLIMLDRFAADATPSANPVEVAAVLGPLWTTGAGADDSGNVWTAWHVGADLSDADWKMYAAGFDTTNTLTAGPFRVTPQLVPEGADTLAQTGFAVGPDGSLTAGWTMTDTNAGTFQVMARHYDPIVAAQSETDTLTPASGLGSVSVVSQATTVAGSVLWEYWVTNNTTHSMGQFTMGGQPAGVTDVANSLGWAAASSGVGWSASSSAQYLAAGATGYFTFSTPSAYAIQPTTATADGGNFTASAMGAVLGPGLTAPETDTLLAGSLDGQVTVLSSVSPSADGGLTWDYEVTNNSSSPLSQFTFLDPVTGAETATTSLGWAFNADYSGWTAGQNDAPIAPGQTADFSFTTAPIVADHTAIRIGNSDSAEGNVLGPWDPADYSQTQTSTVTAASGQTGTVDVVSSATVFDDYTRWQYHITNNTSSPISSFNISADLTRATDVSSTLGWAFSNTGGGQGGWAVGAGAAPLAAGADGYFFFDGPVYWSIGGTPVHADTGNGVALAPVPFGPIRVSAAQNVMIDGTNYNWGPGHYPADHDRDTQAQWLSVAGVPQPNIPFKRDLSVDKLWQNDPNLLPMTVTWPAGPLRPEFRVIGAGQARLDYWSDQKKNAPYFQAGNRVSFVPDADQTGGLSTEQTATIYLEGIRPSISVGDTKLVVYLIHDGVTDVWVQRETVLPVVKGFSATPAPGQNVYFKHTFDAMNGHPTSDPRPREEGWQGMVAVGLTDVTLPDGSHRWGPDNAMTFTADVVAPTNSVKFLQNANLPVGSSWTFQHPDNDKRQPQVTRVLPTYYDPAKNWTRFVDSLLNPPYYSTLFDPAPTADAAGDGVILQTFDSPGTGTPNQDAQTETDWRDTNLISLAKVFQMYLVVQLADGSIYPLENAKWTATFSAKNWATDLATGQGLGPTTINGSSGVVVNRKPQLDDENPWTAQPPTVQKALNWIGLPSGG
jgi:hypothetical protein